MINNELRKYLPVIEGVTKLFYPYIEGALHDLRNGRIVALYNNISKRKVGDPSAINKFIEKHINEFPDIFEPYYKTNWDGKKLKCVSITIRDEKGIPIGLICLNFDASVFQNINLQLDKLVTLANSQSQNPIEQFTEDWQQRVNDCITNYLKENHTTLKILSKEQKQEVVNRLYNHGLFNYRKAVDYIGEQLSVSRATVYNYLK